MCTMLAGDKLRMRSRLKYDMQMFHNETADIFTKPLDKGKFECLRDKLNLCDFSVIT